MKFLRLSLVLFALTSLVACDQVDDFKAKLEGETPSATTPKPPQVLDQSEDRLAFLRTETDTSGANPEFCLVFSSPLDPERNYEPFVAIDRNVAIAAKGERLCLAGLRYGEEAQLTVRAGLPDYDGRTLPRDETVAVTFGERPPAVQFAGNGVILPKKGGDGLAINTVNVESVSVRITRLNDRALALREITEGYNADEGSWGYLDWRSRPEELGATVFEGTLETPGPLNQLTSTSLPIREAVGEMEPGAYLVEIADKAAEQANTRRPARAARWVVVTDLAMTAYRGTTGLDVTVRSLQSARPQRGQTVRLIAQSNEVLAEARTDRSGRVRFAAPLLAGREGNIPKLITVEGRDDFAMLDLTRAPLDLSAQPVGGTPSLEAATAFLYLDRGIYRPGETIHASALVRDTKGFALTERPGALVLYRPNGLAQRRLRFDQLEQAGAFITDLTLPKSASRGVWRIALELDALGEVGSTRLNVEDFVPQRLKMALDSDTNTPLRPGEDRGVSIDLQFLYGAPGAGLTVTGDARLEVDPSPFDAWPGFSFALADKPFRQQMIQLGKTVTDGEGAATLPLSAGQRGGEVTEPLRLRTVIRAEEPGGRAIQDDIIVPYRSRDTYVGLKPNFDGSAEIRKPVLFELVTVNHMGEPIQEDVNWRIRRRVYDYDWYQEANGRWRWRRSERRVTEAEGVVKTGSEGATIEGPKLSWGDYEIEAFLSGEPRASQRFWVGYSGRADDGSPAPDSVRVLGPDEPVAMGSTTSIAIQAPYAGQAEVAIASNGIISLQHIELPEEGTEVEIPVTEAWGTGAYVLVSVYTDRDPDERPVPRRAVGATYVPVDVSDRTFDVSLNTKDVARANEPLAVQLSIANAPTETPVFATLAAVDEGILLLTKHASPDPANALFGKRRLGVDLYDDYGRLLDPNKAEAGVLRSGGDGIGGAGLSAVPTKSVVLFEGPINLDADGRADLTLDLPDFNGTLRLMAVAWSQAGVGASSDHVITRDPVPSELILPRFLAPGDAALATLTLDNVEGAPGTYSSTITANSDDLLVPTATLASELAAGKRSDDVIAIKAARVGITELELNVEGPGGFQAASTYPFEVRGAFLPVTSTERVTLAPGESFTPGTKRFAGLVSGSAELFVTASSSPIDVAALGATLQHYPYACTEQLVSRATPLLFRLRLTPKERTTLQSDVDALLERQSPDGSFGMWRVGDRRASPWLGAYAADFLSRAKDKGLIVPNEAMDRAFQALQPIAQGEMHRAYGYNSRAASYAYSADTVKRLEDRSGAYALYVLARAGKVDRTRLRYVHDARLEEIESPLARAQIAAALATLGDTGRAENAFASLPTGAYTNAGDWYQSPIRDQAAIAELLLETGNLDEAVNRLNALSRRLDPDRLGTQERAFLLRAVAQLTRDDDQVSVRFRAGQTNAELITDAADAETPFTNESDKPVFLTVQATGIPATPPPAVTEQLDLEKRVFTIQGDNVDGLDFTRGDRAIVRLRLSPQREAPGQYVITDLLPAGWEIETVLSSQDGGPNGGFRFLGELAQPDIAEARDDRFVASHIIAGRESRQYAYIVRAVTPGTFTAPGAVAEDMYRPDVYARTQAGQLTVAP